MMPARLRCQCIRLIGVLSLVVLAAPTMDAAATANSLDVTSGATDGQVLTGAACSGEGHGVLMVTGEQFTPGGEVDIGLFVSSDTHPVVLRSIRASQPLLGPNGSRDPALGYRQGGFIGLTLGPWCQELTTVRAYDRQRDTWSNELRAFSALAAVQPVKQILLVTHVGRPSADLRLMGLRLIVPSGARWEIDSDAGPLTLAVESGQLGVVLDGGLARIERQQSPLQTTRFKRLDVGEPVSLFPGDRLFVIRGNQLRVDNDAEGLAAAVLRVIRGPLRLVAAGDYPDQHR